MSGREIDPKYGVAPSPRVVAEGESIPKGGGRELVGKPYVIEGRTYVPQDYQGYTREGLASWYGTAFHGRLTANGEVFDRYSIAAAHPTLPLPSYARVTNLRNKRSIVVRVNDRGPYHADRIMDVSERVAEALDFRRAGTARVRVEYLRKASLKGSDDEKLLATLRENGQPVPGMTTPVMVADRVQAGTARRQALAFNPDLLGDSASPEAPASQTASERSRRIAAAALPSDTQTVLERPASAIPLPPDRPFDLETIPDAATPVRGRTVPVAQLPPTRPLHVSLFTAPDLSPSRVAKDNQPQRFVALKGQP
jgi:rare lipoprotein A